MTRYGILLILTALMASSCSLFSEPTASDSRGSVSEGFGVFLTQEGLDEARQNIHADTEPYATSYRIQENRADNAMTYVADPFEMSDILQIRDVETPGGDGIDNTLDDAIGDFKADSDIIRTLALQHALTLSESYADKAVELMLVWAGSHTPVNLYDFNPNFSDATLTVSGTDRTWSFALDLGFQVYGLINISDAYSILRDSGYAFTDEERGQIISWIEDVAAAINSGHHAWIRYIDSHPSASAGTTAEYTSNNHLTWHLAGLLAASVALEDPLLAEYVLNNGSWTDSRGYTYSNTSSLDDIIRNAIETSGDSIGRLYEEQVRNPPMGYSLFHLQALTLVSLIADTHYEEDYLYSMNASDPLYLAYERYAGYLLGEIESPSSGESRTNLLSFSGFFYEIVESVSHVNSGDEVLDIINRNSFIDFAIGPVSFLYGME